MKKLARLLSLLMLVAFSLFTPVSASAQTAEWGGECVYQENVATLQGLECLLGNFLSVILAIIGLAAFIMLIIGAFRWMLSGSNPKGAETARNTITFAIIGIVVALSGFIILNLLSSFTGLDLTEFIIPGSDSGVSGEGTQAPTAPDSDAGGGGSRGFN
ncbi:MAG: pilin [Patescibacteria group bacterium]